MQQVLEAPEIRDAECISTAVSGDCATEPSQKREVGAIEKAEKTRQPITLLRPIISAFTKTKPQHMLDDAAVYREQRELPIDRICRTNPFLLAFSG
jgi:hypothetical protein